METDQTERTKRRPTSSLGLVLASAAAGAALTLLLGKLIWAGPIELECKKLRAMLNAERATSADLAAKLEQLENPNNSLERDE